MYGQICGSICLMHRNGAKEKWAIEKPKLDNARTLRGATSRGIGKKARQNLLLADESTRIRLEGALYVYYEDHIAANGTNSLSHHNLVHKLIPMLVALEIPDARAAKEKEWRNWE